MTVEPDVTFSALDGLAKFLSQRGNTLLIKGYAGAGKTTLALQLLRSLSKKADGRGIYISSRVSEEKVHKELPWLKMPDRGRGRKSEFMDVRLGSASSFLDEILRAIKPKGRQTPPPVVVLDTWDGIAKEMEGGERLKAEKTLIALADSSKTRMIFVSEEPERTTMDYLVDGMIELTRGEELGRVFREVEIQKLRGTLINQHRYLYSLVGGMFQHLQPYRVPDYSRASRPPPMEGPGNTISFGCESLDGLFGGLVKGGSFGFVYDDQVPYPAIRLTELSAIVNALNTGRGVVMVPLPGAAHDELAGLIKPFVPERAYKECLAIGSLGAASQLEPPFYAVSDANLKETAGRISELTRKVRGSSELKSVLVVEAVGTFEGVFASKLDTVLEGTMKRVAATRESGADSFVMYIQDDSVVRSRLLAMAGRDARLLMKDGSVVLMGEKPATPAYALDHSPENPLLAQLTLIV